MSLKQFYNQWISPQHWLDRAGVRAPMQIAIGLVLLMICVVQFAKVLQLLPGEDQASLRVRTMLAQMTSSRVAYQLSEDDFYGATQFLRQTIHDNKDILSAALRRTNGTIVFQTPGHDQNWAGALPHASTPTHIQVQLYADKAMWGRLELAFAPLHAAATWDNWWRTADARLAMFLIGGCLILFWLFLSRMLKMLDPSSAVPERMQVMMDTLVEGMVILDNEDQIVMTNQAFARLAFLPMDRLIGRTLSSLPWIANEGIDASIVLPWRSVQVSNLPERGVPLRLQVGTQHDHRLNVNASPILDPNGIRRGVLVTFDDQSLIESDNLQLSTLITQFTRISRDFREFQERMEPDASEERLHELDELGKAVREIAALCQSVAGIGSVSTFGADIADMEADSIDIETTAPKTRRYQHRGSPNLSARKMR